MKRLIPVFMLVAYSAALIKIMVFKDMPTLKIGSLMLNFAGTDGGHPANFVPFKTIMPYLLGENGLLIAGVNLVGNIALLMPVGFLLPFVYRGHTGKKSLAIAIAAGLSIELMQVVLRVGIFDIDDVILNALGTMVGYGISLVLVRWVNAKRYKHIGAVMVLSIATAAAGYGLVVYPMARQHQQMKPDMNVSADNLCGDTRGTGQIVGSGDNTITIRRNDGSIQTVGLTSRTSIKTSAGPASLSELKAGERVTLVVDESETAAAILVCSVFPNSGP